MMHTMRALGITLSAALLTSCAVDNDSAIQNPLSANGYTVGYGYTQNQVSYYTGDYVGYGGWASNYYSPAYRYRHLPRR
jgi:hypothetical protein